MPAIPVTGPNYVIPPDDERCEVTHPNDAFKEMRCRLPRNHAGNHEIDVLAFAEWFNDADEDDQFDALFGGV